MTDLAAHGIEVSLPAGWEGRLFKRPSAGDVAASEADGPPAPQGETTNAVLHASTIALPRGSATSPAARSTSSATTT